MAQSVERLTWAQVMISRFVSSSPWSGSVLTAQSLEPASDSVSPSLCPSPAHALSLSVSQKINKRWNIYKKWSQSLQKENARVTGLWFPVSFPWRLCVDHSVSHWLRNGGLKAELFSKGREMRTCISVRRDQWSWWNPHKRVAVCRNINKSFRAQITPYAII